MTIRRATRRRLTPALLGMLLIPTLTVFDPAPQFAAASDSDGQRLVAYADGVVDCAIAGANSYAISGWPEPSQHLSWCLQRNQPGDSQAVTYAGWIAGCTMVGINSYLQSGWPEPAGHVQWCSNNNQPSLSPVPETVGYAGWVAGCSAVGVQLFVSEGWPELTGHFTWCSQQNRPPGFPEPTTLPEELAEAAATELATALAAAAHAEAAALDAVGTVQSLAGGEADGQGNTGDRPPTASDIDTDADFVAIARKVVIARQLEPYVAHALVRYTNPTTESEVAPLPFYCILNPTFYFSTRSAATPGCPDPFAVPTPTYDSPRNELVGHPIYLQETYYTCGPSTARAVLKQMTGTDFTEGALVAPIGTTTKGSSAAGVTKAINERQSGDEFAVEAINSPTELMTRVVIDVDGDVDRQRHATVLNVNQGYLRYWNRPVRERDGHFNFASGYDFREGGTLVLGDGGNPDVLGRQVVELADAFKALKGHAIGPFISW